MRTISTTIDIAAPPHRVWETLTDFGSYPEWNPFIRSLSGETREGSRLEAVLQLDGRTPSTFRPVVTRCEPDRAFEWLGRLGIGGLFDGRHRFELHPLEDGTRFRHSETFGGILAGVVLRRIGAATRRSFEAMNTALEARVVQAT